MTANRATARHQETVPTDYVHNAADGWSRDAPVVLIVQVLQSAYAGKAADAVTGYAYTAADA